jgi:hypothetical protein
VYANTPDRRVFFIIIATPILGGVDDTGQDMYDIPKLDEELPPKCERVQHEPMRGGSVVSDKFGDGIKEDPDAEMEPPLVQRRMRHSMACADEDNPQPPAADEEEEETIDLLAEEEDVRTQVHALQLNRQLARAEAERRKKRKEKERTDAKGATSKNLKLETNAFGWSYNSTIMIRPTVELFWYNMNRRRGLHL